MVGALPGVIELLTLEVAAGKGCSNLECKKTKKKFIPDLRLVLHHPDRLEDAKS